MTLRYLLAMVPVAVLLSAPASTSAACSPSSGDTRTLASADHPASAQMVVGCPLSEPLGRSQVSVHVLAWCNLPAPHRQILFKLKVSITNRGSQTIGIDTSHWRILVSNFVQGRWTPPPRHGTQRPVVVRWAGRNWWAVPANLDGAAEPDPFQPAGTYTFATHWDGVYLGPGASYVRHQRYQGDMVFYVPDNDPASPETNLRGDVALAYFVGNMPTVVVPSYQWGPKLPGASF